jgi:signal transduction histidine kinase/DNA-binding response OmpR family regulator
MRLTWNSLQFAALPPGNYTLHIRARSGKSGWSKNPLRISVIIEKAFYATWWAYAVYILSALGMMYAGFRLYDNRQKIQRRWQLEREHARQLEEMDEAKTRFFTNLAHELRTPLSLIKGPAGKIRQAVTDNKTKGFAGQIDRQVDTMLHLIDQMLEIGRIESGTEKLVMVHADVVPMVHSIAQAFYTLASHKEIQFELSTDLSAFVMDFDADKLQKILYNLLSNAFKFTPAGGKITLALQAIRQDETQQIHIIISDTGIGIASEALPHIFDRFFQADSSITRAFGGTGIGLSYVKELVTLHGGSISVESQPEKGASFLVTLPVVQKQAYQMNHSSPDTSPTANDISPLLKETVVAATPQKELPLVLVIEDHRELAGFIASCLEGIYRVVCAYDGVQGCELAIGQVPDLIITDLMMPKMDGLSLTRQLKTHLVTSHIPLVMLTAKSTPTERLTGLDGGADAYITKPFAVEELTLTLRNLLYLRDHIANNFRQTWPAEEQRAPALVHTGAAHSFLSRLTQIAEENLSNENFGVNELLPEIGMSRTQLHRKLKALSGQSAHELMRNMKMQKALQLLSSTNLPVAQVAMQVGFGNASHFTKIFVEHYGFLPSAAKEKQSSL